MFNQEKVVFIIVVIVIVILIFIVGTRNWWRLAPAKDYWFVSWCSGQKFKLAAKNTLFLCQESISSILTTFAGKLIEVCGKEIVL